MRELLLLTYNLTFQLDFGLAAFAASGEVWLKLLKGLRKLYFQNL